MDVKDVYKNLGSEVAKACRDCCKSSPRTVARRWKKSAAARYCAEKIKPQMAKVRIACDDAERLMDADLYPFPTYETILYSHHEDSVSGTTLDDVMD